MFRGSSPVSFFAPDFFAIHSGSLSGNQPEDRNLRPAIEAHGKQVAQATADIEPAAVIEVELASGVSAVFYPQQRRRGKRGGVLAAPRVAWEGPAFENPPRGFFGGSRVLVR